MEKELNLWDYIQVLYKGRWIIIVITIIITLATGIYSFYFLTPQYEGRATLMVNQVKFAQNQSQSGKSNIDAFLQNLSRYPEMTMETYRTQLTNPALLKEVIQELKLDHKKYNIDSLERSIRTEVVKNTNIINVIVKGDNPQDVARIANSVAVNFVVLISGQGRHQMGQSLVFLKDQMAEEQKNLELSFVEYNKFLAQTRGVHEVKAEINAKVALVTEFKNQLIKNNVEIQQTNSALSQLESDLAQIPEKLVTKKSISEDTFLLQVLGDATGSAPHKLSGLRMDSEVINDIYIEMGKKRAELRVRLADLKGQQNELEYRINEIQQQLERLQVEMAEKGAIDDRLSHKVKTLRTNLEALSTRYEETRLSQTANMGEANISFLAPALEPQSAVGPRKMLNIAVAGIMGVIVGVFIVVIIKYWRDFDVAAKLKSPKADGIA